MTDDDKPAELQLCLDNTAPGAPRVYCRDTGRVLTGVLRANWTADMDSQQGCMTFDVEQRPRLEDGLRIAVTFDSAVGHPVIMDPETGRVLKGATRVVWIGDGEGGEFSLTVEGHGVYLETANSVRSET